MYIYFLIDRVMDAFLIEGMEIIFRLAVAILNYGKEDLLSLDMEGMLKVRYRSSLYPNSQSRSRSMLFFI